MKKIYTLILVIGCFFNIYYCNGLTPNFSLVSISAPSPINQYDCYSVSATMHNNGPSGTYDFECDLESPSGATFYRFIEKKCSNVVASGANITLTFSTSSTSTNANHSSITQAAGSYAIQICAIYSSCFQCGNSGCPTQYIGALTPITIQSASCSGYCMSNTSVSTCSGTFYDSGGNGNYGNNLNLVETFSPSISGNMLRFSFSSFSIENNWDYLYIYDGPNTSSSLIGTYTGSTSPGTITATNANGQLTLKFTSDNSNNCSTGNWYGWQASISCVSSGSAPTASFTVSQNSVTQGGTITTTNNSTGNPTPTYSWTASPSTGLSFSPSNTATSPSITFANTGTYTIYLTATNSISSSQTSKTITVTSSGSAPTASFTVSQNSVTQGGTITTTNNSTGNPTPTYSWTASPSTGVSFSPSNTATSPSITFANTGTYTIYLTATNSISSSQTSKTITVTSSGSAPTASFTVSQNSVTQGGTITTTNNSTGNPTPTYSWTASPSTGVSFSPSNTATSPSITFANTGTYTIYLTATNSISSSQTSKTIVVNTSPTYYISGTVKDVLVNTKTRTIDLEPYGGCTVTAYDAGTSTSVGSGISSYSDGSFSINVPANGTYDILAVDNSSPSNKVKMFGVASNSNVGNINIPATLLNQISNFKNQLANLKATISSIPAETSISSYNVSSQTSTLNQWKNITANYNAIVETAGSLYLADSVLVQFYANANLLNNEVATDIYEMLQSALSCINIFVGTQEAIDNSNIFDKVLRYAIEKLQKIIVDKIKDAIDESLTFLPTENYYIKKGIDAAIDELQSDNSLQDALNDVIQPLVENLTAQYLLQTEYVQLPNTQATLNYTDNNAANLTYSGTFTNNFNQTNILTAQATGAAQIAQSNSSYHRNLSSIISFDADAFNVASEVSDATGLVPLAAILEAFAIGGQFWSFGELANSFSIAYTGFNNNITSLPPAVNATFLGNGHLPLMKSSFPSFASFQSAVDTAIYKYDSTITDFKNALESNNIQGVIKKFPNVVSKNRLLFDTIKQAFAPVNATAINARQSIANYDSLFYSNFLYTLNKEPIMNQRFQFLNLALLVNNNDTAIKNLLIKYADSLIICNQNISHEFTAMYSMIDTVNSLNYIQDIQSNIPKVIENDSSKNCYVVVKNIGPSDCTGLYAKVSFGSPFITNIDSIFIGNLVTNQQDSLFFTLTAPFSDTIVNYSIVFYASNTIADNFVGAIKSESKPQRPPISFNTNLCFGDTLKLYANDYNFYNRYYWNGPDGFSSNLANPVIPNFSTNISGLYTCYIISQGLKSDTSKLTVSITIPYCLLTISGPATFCQGDSVELLITNYQLQNNYQWKLNGNIITGATSSAYTAYTTGSYAVEVTNSNNCPVISDSVGVTVNTSPTATITTLTATTFCQGDSVQLLTTNYQLQNNYQWKLNGNIISGATSSAYTADTTGSYAVEVTNPNNCPATSDSVAVAVNPLPTVAITPLTATTFCQGDSVQLLITNYQLQNNYQWKLKGNIISGATSSAYTAYTTGSYAVEVTNSNNCPATSDSVAVAVNTLPTATITPLTATTFCQGDSVQLLTTNYLLQNNYQWELNGNIISGATSSAYTAYTTGSYAVEVTNSNNCPATSDSVAVAVNTLPTATITPLTATTFCQGDSVQLLITNYQLQNNYQWKLNENIISGATSSAYTAYTTGSYAVEVTNSNNCPASSDSVGVTVNTSPIISAAPTDQTKCQGDSVIFSVSVTGTNLSYQWTKGGTNDSGATGTTYTINNIKASDYDFYSCIISNTCGSTQLPTFTLTVISPPVLSIIYVSQTKSVGDSVSYTLTPGGTGPFIYQWMNRGNNITGATNSIFNINHITCSDTGIYTCSIGNSCGAIIAKVVKLYVSNCTKFSISGYVSYDNGLASSGMSKTNVHLANAEGIIIKDTTTDKTGYYLFENLVNGTYNLTCISTSLAWGGVNPVDALLVDKTYIGLNRLTDLLLRQAADVNDDGKINPIDALLIDKRYIRLIHKFAIPDWIFSNPTVTIDNADINENIMAICAGDVNASYSPPARITNYELRITNEKQINIDINKPFDIPVYLSSEFGVQSSELGAMGIKLRITNYELRIISIKSDLEGMIYNISDNEVDIAWAAEDEGYSVTPDKPLFVLSAQCSGLGDTNYTNLHELKISRKDAKTQKEIDTNYTNLHKLIGLGLNNCIQITSESVLADIEGNYIGTDKLAIPEIIITNYELRITNYPNPFNNITNINYSIPEDANVELNLYNVLGQKIAGLVTNERQQAGNHSLQYDGSSLRQGVYYLQLRITNYELGFNNSIYTKTNMLMIAR